MTASVIANRKLSDWLRFCKEIGWPKEAMPKLCDVWWQYHDDDGNLTDPK